MAKLSYVHRSWSGKREEKERKGRGRRNPTTKNGKGRAEVSKGRRSEERIDEFRSRQPFVNRSCAPALKHRCASQKKTAFISVRSATQWRFSSVHGQSAAITRVCLLRVCIPGRLTRLSAERGFQRHGRHLGWPSAATNRALRSLFAEAFGSRLWVAYRR